MKYKKHLGVLIAYGAEIRSFIYSGLLERLLSEYRISIFSLKDVTHYYSFPDTVQLFPFPLEYENYYLQKCRRISGKLHGFWFEKAGKKRWSYTIKDKKVGTIWQRSRDNIINLFASPGTVIVGATLERAAGHLLGTCDSWKKFFYDQHVDGVLSLSFESSRVLPALQTAANLNLKNILIMHSWKEPYKNPHLSTLPERILLWNPLHATMVMQCNPWIEDERVTVTGSLHLSPFFKLRGLLPREEFSRQTGLDPDRPFICYTAADPRSVRNEEHIVAYLLEAIATKRLPEDYQLLIRLNPVEDSPRFAQLLKNYSRNLVIQRPQWEWLPEISWISPLAQDTNLWVSTAYYSAMNISLPSTVTLEFGVLKKPVINICFDLPNALPPAASNRRFWESDWYAEIREMNLALPAFDQDELIARISEVASQKYQPGTLTDLPSDESWLFLDAVAESKKAIDEVMLS